VVRLVQGLDPDQRLVHRQAAGIDLLRFSDDARDSAEAARHPHGAGVGEGRQPPVEHAGVEFVGLAVHIHHGAGEMHAHQRHAALHHPGEEHVHAGVLGSAEQRQVEPHLVDEVRRIEPAGMGRVEDHRRPRLRRLQRLEGGVDVADLGFHRHASVVLHACLL
jgi:hypothetical protein